MQHPWSVPWLQSAPGHRALPVQSGASLGAFEKQHKGERLFPAQAGVGGIGLTRWDGAEGEAGLDIC